MDPDRWAAIAGTFAAERGDYETSSARRSVSHPHLNRDVHLEEDTLENFSKNHHKTQSIDISNPEEDDRSIINVLKRIIKEKVEEIHAQNKRISLLNQEISMLKGGKAILNAFTQTGESSESRSFLVEKENEDTAINTKEAISQTEKYRNILEVDEKSKPLLEITEKMELMEKRMDALVTFIQGHFPKSTYSKMHFDKLGTEVHPLPSVPTKVWTKPPTLQPRASYCSVLREAYSRTGSNNIVHPRESWNSTGNTTSGQKFCSYPRINEADPVRDTHQDPIVEQRLQFLESLVAQLKGKFMKVLQVQRRHIAMTKGVKWKGV